jgi:hypothetical protein
MTGASFEPRQPKIRREARGGRQRFASSVPGRQAPQRSSTSPLAIASFLDLPLSEMKGRSPSETTRSPDRGLLSKSHLKPSSLFSHRLWLPRRSRKICRLTWQYGRWSDCPRWRGRPGSTCTSLGSCGSQRRGGRDTADATVGSVRYLSSVNQSDKPGGGHHSRPW